MAALIDLIVAYSLNSQQQPLMEALPLHPHSYSSFPSLFMATAVPQRPQQACLLSIPFPPPTGISATCGNGQLVGTSSRVYGPLPTPLLQLKLFFLLGLSYKAHLPAWRGWSMTSQGPSVLKILSCQLLLSIYPVSSYLPFMGAGDMTFVSRNRGLNGCLSKLWPINCHYHINSLCPKVPMIRGLKYQNTDLPNYNFAKAH